MARFLKQDLPPRPDGLSEKVVKLPFVLFKGGTDGPRRHLRNLAAARPTNRRAMQVFWSWLQGSKRGLPQVPEEFILATKRKHCAALSQQLPPIPGNYLDEFTRDLKELFRGIQSVGIRSYVDEDGALIRGKRVIQCKRDRQLRPWCGNPGWNDACASHSRSEGGKTQCVRQWISSRLKELEPQDDSSEKVNEVSSFLRSKHLLPKVPMATIAKWAQEDTDAVLDAQVCVIQEPLKARVITKGDARAYYAVMPLQKDCWKHLAAKEEFSLIGRPLAEEHLINIDQGTARVLAVSGLKETFDKWVSGDYSAATDGLSLEISQLALQQYMRSVGLSEKDDLWQLASKALGAHKVSYGKTNDGTESDRQLPDDFIMKNGQLMGSPMSFPILCAINFVAYKTALRQYIKARGGNWDEVAKLKSLPVCVNGDDILFKANEDFYTNFWQPAIKAIGFSLSQGKNYFAGSFLTVNSEGWRPMKNGRFQKLGYLNTGLIYAGPNGSMRPPLRQSHAEMPWTGKFQECLNGCVNPKRTLCRLLHFYGNDVWSHTKGGRLNLFAKVEQGGLGISLPPGIEPGWTWFQKALAHHLRHKVFNFFEECKVSLGAEMIFSAYPKTLRSRRKLKNPRAKVPMLLPDLLRAVWRDGTVILARGKRSGPSFLERSHVANSSTEWRIVQRTNPTSSVISCRGRRRIVDVSTIDCPLLLLRQHRRRRDALRILHTFLGSYGEYAHPMNCRSSRIGLTENCNSSRVGKKAVLMPKKFIVCPCGPTTRRFTESHPCDSATRTSSLPLSHGMPGRCNAKKGQLDPKGFHKIPSARPDTVIGRSGLRVYRLVLEAPSRNGKPCGIPGFPDRVPQWSGGRWVSPPRDSLRVAVFS